MDNRYCLYCEGELKGKQEFWCSESCRKKGYRVGVKPDVSPGATNGLEAIDKNRLIAELSRRGFAVEVNALTQDKRYELKVDRFKKEKCIKIGVVSCPHFGSRYQQLTALREFYKVCADREIDTVLNTGDIIDGDGSVYPGQIYEMFLQGSDPQRDYAIENYPEEDGITTKTIGGNHDNSFVKSGNTNVLEQVAKERKDIEYLGEYGAFIDFDIGGTIITVYLMHGGGQSNPYARSYKLQKIVENFTPENKPHIVFLGHWHVGCHLPQYRNVEAFLMGAFQAQTPHLKRLGIWPTTTALILEIYPDDTGIARIRSEWLHWHLQRERDY